MVKLPKIPKDWKSDLRRLPKVEIDWDDATVYHGWSTDTDTQECVHMKTVGYMIPPKKKQVRLLYSITGDGGHGYMWLIPHAWVKKVKVLK